MILKSITPRHYGPFAANSMLTLDSEVTVITGPNDVGKSLALRAIQILCTENSTESHEINRDRIGEFSGKWNDDPEICCEAQFEISEQAIEAKNIPREWTLGTIITVRKRINVKSRNAQLVEVIIGKKKSQAGNDFSKFPSVLFLPLQSEIRQIIELGKMNEAESQFVRLGFGNQFSLEQHKALDEIDRTFRIDEAADRLNTRLQRILPSQMPMRFRLLEIAAKPESLGVGLVDEHKGYAPLGSRGAGVRKLLNVMGALLLIEPTNGHSIILYDEPETSLHSDAQHRLRLLLESLASNSNIQVVYTTHSAAMINTLRPNAIRVIERRHEGEKAVSCFINDAYSENYSLVRSSLGITPSDSLLYSPITIIVEGPTEVRCLPIILTKLAADKIIDRLLLDLLLPQTHILDGEGAKYEYMCRLVKSQKAIPILFLDGDRASDLSKVKEKHPEVPIILLPSGTEYEEIVPRARYIEAVAQLLVDSSNDISEASYEAWHTKFMPKSTMMFSKRIERWLEDDYGERISKPLLMEKAIELSLPSEIQAESFQRLVQAMKAISDKL